MTGPPPGPSLRRRLMLPASLDEVFLVQLLRQEAIGGLIVLTAAVVAVAWANSGWSEAYDAVRHQHLGPLDLEHWAADGGLAIFFYLAGLEVKRELLLGSLREPLDALVPIVAAIAGVAVPAAIFTAVNLTLAGEPSGWAIPAATDIAFALAVLALVGRQLPTELRAFLLTLAVVDDLIVIAVIAVFYTATIHLVPLLVAAALLGVFVFLQRFRGEPWVVYVPLSIGIWWAVHESGIHAGVLMGLATRVRLDPGERRSPAEALEHLLTPVSAGLAVPFFALMSAGVAIRGGSTLLHDPIFWGVVAGLVLGKPIGVLGGAWLVTRLTHAELNDTLSWRDLSGVALLAGVGFTVALLVSDLSFTGAERDTAKTAVLVASVLAATSAAVVLHRRSRAHAD